MTLSRSLTALSPLTLAALGSLLLLSTPEPVVAQVEVVDAPDKTGMTGKLVEMKDRRLLIDPSNSDEKVIRTVAKNAKILLNEKPVALSALKPGDVLRVSFLETDPEVLTRIQAARLSTADRTPTGPKDRMKKSETPKSDYDGNPQPTGKGAGFGVAIVDSPNQGVLVVDVTKGSPADVQGVRVGDFLMALNDRGIKTPQSFLAQLSRSEPGETLRATVWRRGETMSISTAAGDIAKTYDREADDASLPLSRKYQKSGMWLGAETRPVSDGLEVVSVLPDGPADEAGLRAGDVIRSIDNQPVSDREKMLDVLSKKSGGAVVNTIIERGGNAMTVRVKLQAPPNDAATSDTEAKPLDLEPEVNNELELDPNPNPVIID